MKVGFIGSVNCMPMMYACKFKEEGFDVKYIVEAPVDNTLNRPECQFPKFIQYPYPSWIIEIPWENDLLRYGALPYSNRRILDVMADRDIIFLNDYGIAIASFLPKKIIKVALSSAADIDQTCQWSIVPYQAMAANPRRWRLLWWLLALRRTWLQRKGLKACMAVSYFPKGLNPDGDLLIESLSPPDGFIMLPRFDVSFKAAGTCFSKPHDRPLTDIFIGVRFKLFTAKGMDIEYKGNDIILRALAEYLKRRPNKKLRIHLMRKGDSVDLSAADDLCKKLELDRFVIWHQPMPLPKLLELYKECDVCFDQVGTHWIGAIAFYGLHMGRPVIANARLRELEPYWGVKSPILNATNEAQIIEHLLACEDPLYRENIGIAGHEFAVQYLDVDRNYQQMKKFAFSTVAHSLSSVTQHQSGF